MEISVERVTEEIDDELYKQFQAIDEQFPDTTGENRVTFEAQKAMTEICGDNWVLLHQLRAYLYLCREMTPKTTIPSVNAGCNQTEVVRMVRAAGQRRRHRDPLRHERFVQLNN